ncbi:MAG: hypothetical protein RBU27_05490 [Bacteroidota bacterium]|nr:hypothetical protein [Bacteroidota bacterium]
MERDDAEASLLMEQRNLEEKNHKIILELLKNLPTVSAAGVSEMGVGEVRWHTIGVKGLGDNDNVTTPPLVLVMNGDKIIDTLSYPEEILDSVVTRKSDSTLNASDHLYSFPWKAPSIAGNYALIVQAGTDRIATFATAVDSDTIKLGPLHFQRHEIQNAIDSDPLLRGTPLEAFISRSENLRSDTLYVAVQADELDPLQLQVDPIITAVGYATFNEVKVRGTTPDKVATINASFGSVLSPNNPANPWCDGAATDGKWAWSATFHQAGKQIITVDARDHRQAGVKSVSRPTTFTVDVRKPVLLKSKPAGAFAGEIFSMDLAVDGLEDAGSYEWTAKLEDVVLASGNFSSAAIPIPADATGKSFSIIATYKGKPYMVATGETLVSSTWMYGVTSPSERLGSASFANGGEYPINNVFQFVAARCGRCTSENIANIDAKDIRVTVEDHDGRDLLDEVTVMPRVDPNTGRELGTVVKFFLKGKVSSDGTEAVISVRYGIVNESYNIVLIPE